MNQTKKELSYFRLKLEGYLRDHHPELVANSAFIVGSPPSSWATSPSKRSSQATTSTMTSTEVVNTSYSTPS